MLMRLTEEKAMELRLGRRNSWCEDGARFVRVVLSVLEGLPRPVLERLIHPLGLSEGELAIVLRGFVDGKESSHLRELAGYSFFCFPLRSAPLFL